MLSKLDENGMEPICCLNLVQCNQHPSTKLALITYSTETVFPRLGHARTPQRSQFDRRLNAHLRQPRIWATYSATLMETHIGETE